MAKILFNASDEQKERWMAEAKRSRWKKLGPWIRENLDAALGEREPGGATARDGKRVGASADGPGSDPVPVGSPRSPRPRTSVCVHRIAPTAFCARCDA